MNRARMNEDKMRTELVKEVAIFYTDTESTIRKTAKYFGRSKSWVHRIFYLELEEVDPELHESVYELLMKNKQERAIRGGKATKTKFRRKRGEIQ